MHRTFRLSIIAAILLWSGLQEAMAQEDEPIRPRTYWAIQFDTESEETYRQQLDALGIELGLVHQLEPKLQYASRLSKMTVYRNDVRRNEKRFFLAATTKQEKAWESDVFAKNGIDTTHCLTVRFLPEALIKKMMLAERAACKELGLTPGVDVRKAHFSLKKTKSGWEIDILSIDRLK